MSNEIGFTMESLGWAAWLPTLDLADATTEQIAVLEESTPTAKSSLLCFGPCATVCPVDETTGDHATYS